MKIYRSYYDSTHFCFEAYGLTKEEAKNQIIKGLKIHAQNYTIPDDWWNDDDIGVYEVQTGKAYRDFSELKRNTK